MQWAAAALTPNEEEQVGEEVSGEAVRVGEMGMKWMDGKNPAHSGAVRMLLPVRRD